MSGTWTLLAASSGGMVAAVVSGLDRDGRIVLFAATPAGIYRSEDEGETWELPASGGGVPFGEALALSPHFAEDHTLFACGGESLYRSTNRGDTWEPVLVGSRMFCVCAAGGQPGDGLVVLAGTEADGLLRSDDSGRSWRGVNAGVMDLTAIALAVSPAFTQDRTSFAGTASALYRSRNGGLSWREVDTGVDQPAVQCLAISPTFAADRLVLAGTEADGLLRSTDAGATWQPGAEAAGVSVTAIAFHPSTPGGSTTPAVAIASETRVAVSRDGGETWQTVSDELDSVLSLTWVGDAEARVLLAGTARRGLVRLEAPPDPASMWGVSDRGPSAGLLTGLALSPAFSKDRTLFAAGLQDGVRCSLDGGRTWTLRSRGLEDALVTGLALSPDFPGDGTLYAATNVGLYASADAGQSWYQSSSASSPVRAVAIIPTGSSSEGPAWRLLIAGDGGALLASDDGARTWHPLGPGFPGAEILSLAVSPDHARDRALFVGTTSAARSGEADQTVLWRSTDGGSRWQRWLVEKGSRDVLPLAVSADHAVSGTVFVGMGGSVLAPRPDAKEVRGGERRPLWRRTEVAKEVTAVTSLSHASGEGGASTLFAASNAGLWLSRDAGRTFRSWSDGLRQQRLVAVVLSPNFAQDHFVLGVGVDGTIWQRRWEDETGAAD